MQLKTMKDLLVQELGELYAAEKHSAEVLPKLAGASSDKKLAAAFKSHAAETKEHLARLERVFEDLRISPPDGKAESFGMKGLCKDCMRLADTKSADPEVRDAALIAVAQHVEHDEIAGYGCARTWAGLLGHDHAASLLQQTLTEERKADSEFSRLAETLNKAALA